MTSVRTARAAGLLVCARCALVSREPDVVPAVGFPSCPRCDAPLGAHRSEAMARCWAFVISAALLYLPANILPVMETAWLFGDQRDTIWSGIVYLWKTGSWPLAIVVFVASMVVPLGKIVVLSYLLVSVQRGSAYARLGRARLYRVLELVGRWSMLDIYVVTLLVALVQLRSLAFISAGNGAIAFGAVVVLTMLATLNFDPRWIWESSDDRRAG